MSRERTEGVPVCEMRLPGMRQTARHRRVQCEARVAGLEAELEAAKRDLICAKQDVAYWDSVRDPDEALRECGFEAPWENVTSGHDFVRDGVALRRCNRTHPCPEHGRPLGGSDWRLHPMSDEFRTGLVTPGRMTERDETVDSNARSTVHREGGVERGGIVYPTPGDLPIPSPDL